MLSVLMLSVLIVSVLMLNVIMLSVVAPLEVTITIPFSLSNLNNGRLFPKQPVEY
jgi:hypothetical protein